jgi:hypothetical protein
MPPKSPETAPPSTNATQPDSGPGPAWLDAIEAKAALATPGPWICHLGQPDDMPEKTCRCRSILAEPYQGAVGQLYVDNGLPIADGGNDCPPEPEARANARLISEAREDVPRMAKEIRRLRGLIKRVEWERQGDPHWTACPWGCIVATNWDWDETSANHGYRHEPDCLAFTPTGEVK